eukprot:scaffold16535_cov123-Cylindrotheca_fusiformis.AAC.3
MANLRELAGINFSTAIWTQKPQLDDVAIPAYDWLTAKEDNTENVKGYMSYLDEIPFPKGLKLFDSSAQRDFLSGTMFDFTFKGSISMSQLRMPFTRVSRKPDRQ